MEEIGWPGREGWYGPPEAPGRHQVTLRHWVLGWSAPLAVGVLAGCITLPGEVSAPGFVPRIVDREYRVVWETLQATLRNEGALGVTGDRERGVIETAFRLRPGTKVWAGGLLGEAETRNNLVQVRYAVRARPLGPEETEVRLRTEILYMDRASRQWVRGVDDGTLMDSFWRRFEEDLAYYGMRPETWRPEGAGREAPHPDGGRSGAPSQGTP